MTKTHTICFHSKSAESTCHYEYHTGLYAIHRDETCVSSVSAQSNALT